MNKIHLILGWSIILAFSIYVIWLLSAVSPKDQLIVLTIVSSVSIAAYTHRTIKMREIESRHFQEKKNDIVKMIKFLHEVPSLGSTVSASQFEKKAKQFWKDTLPAVMAWGSPELLKKVNQFQTTEIVHAGQALVLADELMQQMRIDLGHRQSVPDGMLMKFAVICQEHAELDEIMAQGRLHLYGQKRLGSE